MGTPGLTRLRHFATKIRSLMPTGDDGVSVSSRGDTPSDAPPAFLEHDITATDFLRSLEPTQRGVIRYFVGLFPSIDWVPRYNWRWLLADSIAGLTVGLVVVPQAMAYALLANLTPEFGLYTSFAGAAIYWLFGTSKDIVIGVGSTPSMNDARLLDLC